MPNIPNDDTGAVLRRMLNNGDSLQQPRMIDYCFVFPVRKQALSFAAEVDEIEFEVCISFYEAQQAWQVLVKKHMLPEHSEISRIESDLSDRAASHGGHADGWGCMRIVDQEEAKP